MKKEKLRYTELVKVADVLKASGVQPTIARIRHILKKPVNRAQAAQYLKQWLAAQPENKYRWRMRRKNITAPTQITTTRMDTRKTADVLLKNVSDLEQSLSLVRATLEATADGILMISKEGKVVDWNKKFVDMWRIPSNLLESGDEEPGFKYVLDQVKDPQALFNEVTRLYDNPEERGNLGEIQFKDGRVFERYSQPHRVGDVIVGRVWSFRDITDRRKAEATLLLRDRAIEASTQGIIIIELKQDKKPIIYANPAFTRITQFSESEVLGKEFAVLQGKERDQPGIKKIELAMRELHEDEVVIRSFRKDGSMFWNEVHLAPVPDASGEVKHYVAIINDISERKQMEEQLVKQATHDTLTGLPNRSLLIDRVEQAILRATRENTKIAMMFLDLDRFKLINDSLGHTIGDNLLKEVAERLLKNTRESDTVARIGGDEFIFIYPYLHHEEDAIPLAQRHLAAFSKPFMVGTHVLNVTSSIGVSYYPKDGQDFETLMRKADLSMYHAKDSGRNNFKMYDEDMNLRVTHRLKLENLLRNALEKDEFQLYYQPMVGLRENAVLGAEALLRWKSPQLAYVPPFEFIPLAEETGLIIEIGEWVLRQACEQLKRWHEMGYVNLRASVNLSARQFKQVNFIKTIHKIVQSAHLPPGALELELTESMLIANVEENIEILRSLKEMDLVLAIDDFGTGYSSLNYLKRFPVDRLKIDRSFIKDIAANKMNNDAAIVLAIIKLAHSLNLRVIAEGVETPFQLEFLQRTDCDEAQGFHFSKPISADDFTDYLDAQRSGLVVPTVSKHDRL